MSSLWKIALVSGEFPIKADLTLITIEVGIESMRVR